MSASAPPAAGLGEALVAILLCTWNGAAFLKEQLASIERQTHRHWRLWASDDGSTDGTREHLDAWAARWGAARLVRLDGPGAGHLANFMSLVRDETVHADYYAFCDQDDVWNADKLERAVAHLRTVPPGQPALFCTRTLYVDDDNREFGLSPAFEKPKTFENALTQSIAGGNTMVFNNALRDLLRRTDPDAPGVLHDWLAYLVVTGCGGSIHFDLRPSVRYRQHDANAVGGGHGWSRRLGRLLAVWRGRNRRWHDANLLALAPLEPALTPHNREVLRLFRAGRDAGLVERVRLLRRCGLYRQSRWGTLGLWFAILANRV